MGSCPVRVQRRGVGGAAGAEGARADSQTQLAPRHLRARVLLGSRLLAASRTPLTDPALSPPGRGASATSVLRKCPQLFTGFQA